MNERLYTDLAALWPLISPPEDYAAESAELLAVVREHSDKPRPTVLELGVGGGHVLHHLRDALQITGVDLSPAMLDNCNRLNPGVETVVGDMRTLRLGRRFDVVMIHDAVDYLTTLDDVRATMHTAALHLSAGGPLVVVPTYVRENFQPREVEVDQHHGEGVSVTYLGYTHDPDEDDERFELVLVYLVDRAGKLEVIEDRHACGLFGVAQWLDAIDAAGFDAGHRPYPATGEHVLFTGVRRA